MRSTDVLTERRKKLWNAVRYAVPPRQRWFYEGHPKLRGQLWYAERKLLYETIRAHRPQHCFEIGTWRGGGSTLFISQALHDNGQGMLHTIEIDETFYKEAIRNYKEYLPHLSHHVTLHFGDYRATYKNVLEECKRIDFLILDGAEDAEQTLEQFNFFLPYTQPGTILAVHDWLTEKTRLVRPLLENTGAWEVGKILMPPASLGFSFFARK